MKGNKPNPHAAALGKLGGHARLEKLTPEQTKAELLDTVEKNARAAQIMDDLCARSTLEGLKSCFDFIPQDMVSASMSLAGGAGASSGSCGAFCSGLLAIGLKFNPTTAADRADRRLRLKGKKKFIAFRDAFLKEFGTTLCPELHKRLFGRSFVFTDEAQGAEFFAIADHAEKCAEIVGKAARMAAEILLADGD
jgi:hypothetical protein